MVKIRSFTEYIAKKYENDFWAAIDASIQENFDSMHFDYYKIHQPGEPKIDNITVEYDFLGIEGSWYSVIDEEGPDECEKVQGYLYPKDFLEVV